MDKLNILKIASMLDEVSNTLEAKGLIREASDLDRVANILEREAGFIGNLKKGLSRVQEIFKKIPGSSSIESEFKDKSDEEIASYLITDTRESFKEPGFLGAIMNAAMDPLSRTASTNDEVIKGALLVTLLAGMANKSVSDMTPDGIEKYRQSLKNALGIK